MTTADSTCFSVSRCTFLVGREMVWLGQTDTAHERVGGEEGGGLEGGMRRGRETTLKGIVLICVAETFDFQSRVCAAKRAGVSVA